MAGVIPPELVEPLQQLIGASFSFRELDLILNQSVGKPIIGEFASADWPPQRIAAAAVEGADRYGVERAFLTLLVQKRPRHEALQALIVRVPGMTVVPAQTQAKVDVLVGELENTRRRLDNPDVRRAVGTIRGTLERCHGGVNELAAYKNLHDSLHQIQIRRTLDLDAVARIRTMDDGIRDRFREVQYALETAVTQARPNAETLPVDSVMRDVECAWIERLDGVAARLQAAIDEPKEIAGLGLALRPLARILEQEPTRLNRLIFFATKRLPLGELVTGLAAAATSAPVAGTTLAPASEALADVRVRLLSRVVEHNLWQEADDGLWTLDRAFALSPADAPQAFAFDWPSTKAAIRFLADGSPETEWSKAIRVYSDRVDDELARLDGTTAADPTSTAGPGLASLYKDFRYKVRRRFFEIDQQLKADCAQVVRIGGPLRSILDELARE